MVDWDRDGRKDLLTGEYDGFIRIYRNVGTNAAPRFDGYAVVMVGEVPFDWGHYSTPFAVDWNNDGKTDLLSGEYYGKVHYLENIGTAAAPLFAGPVLLADGAGDLDAGHNSHPVAFDWNGDGRKDLLSGNANGTVCYWENRGSDADPRFDGMVLLEAAGTTLSVGAASRPALSDWDGDGTVDLLCGYHSLYVSPVGGVDLFRAVGPLSADGNRLSAGSGGAIGFRLSGGAGLAGRPYFLLGNVSGTRPGTPLPGGGTLPLRFDGMLAFLLLHYQDPGLSGFRGTLDGAGEAAASLSLRKLPLPVGTVLHFAWTTELPYDFQSNALGVEILP